MSGLAVSGKGRHGQQRRPENCNLTPSPSPERRGESEDAGRIDVSGSPLLSRRGAGGEDIYTIVGCWMRPVSRRVNAQGSFSDALLVTVPAVWSTVKKSMLPAAEVVPPAVSLIE